MATGTVLFFNTNDPRGSYGFIVDDAVGDETQRDLNVFFGDRGLSEETLIVRKGQRVQFEYDPNSMQNGRGPRAAIGSVSVI